MNEAYFQGALGQLEERILQMLERIPSNAAEMELLEQRCRDELASQLELCRELRTSPIFTAPTVRAERLDMYRGLVEQLDLLETVAVAVLVRANDDDLRLNLLMKEIVREIGFPLTRPVVSCSSRNYFHIYPHLNLMFVPLMESRQLLHLPDLYHELCHLILAERNDRRVAPFKDALRETKVRMSGELTMLKSKFSMNKTPGRLTEQLPIWTYCWTNDWGVEFFCDLYAVFATGPAFVWAHVHLCAKRRSLLFALPQIDNLTHPADAARFEVMLEGLRLCGFHDDVTRLQTAWTELTQVTAEQPSDEYALCYPGEVLRWMSEIAHKAYLKMGCRAFAPGSQARVAGLLSEAWSRFWADVSGYPVWENAAAGRLFQMPSAVGRN